MKSWKTFVAGLIGAVGVFVSSQTQYAWAGMVGQILTGLGFALTGMFARDANVSSEQQGIKKAE